jgi:hypothetical protein
LGHHFIIVFLVVNLAVFCTSLECCWHIVFFFTIGCWCVNFFAEWWLVFSWHEILVCRL